MPQPPAWFVYLGAAVGLLGLILHLRNWIMDRSKLRLKLEWDQEPRSFYDNDPKVRITLKNAGRRPLCVERLTIVPTRPGQEPFRVAEGDRVVLGEGAEPNVILIEQGPVWEFCDGKWWRIRAEAELTTGQRRRSPPGKVAPHGRRPGQPMINAIIGSGSPAVPGYGVVNQPGLGYRLFGIPARLLDRWGPF